MCTFVLSIILYGECCLKLVFKFLNLNYSVQFLLFYLFIFFFVVFFFSVMDRESEINK